MDGKIGTTAQIVATKMNKRIQHTRNANSFNFEFPTEGRTNTWLTDPKLVQRLGKFALDPCAAGADYLSKCCHAMPKGNPIPIQGFSRCVMCGERATFKLVTYKRIWDLAKENWSLKEGDSLERPWPSSKRAFVNPPYGPNLKQWIEKCILHGNSIALTFARTETVAFFKAWKTADAFLFLPSRLLFYHTNGELSSGKTAANVLIAWGEKNRLALLQSGIEGAFIDRCKVLPGIRIS